ncbi:CAP domain-containing protein [Streptomyces sp. TRM49041]|uniref:CAP domain-containing protein n=1 Tax=Streptomyces sp. TRM49041 TaxID=2603216 RepID=UPI0016568665|nr:CAP domain-containing protein [Streptomyces sp. TRM49041]
MQHPRDAHDHDHDQPGHRDRDHEAARRDRGARHGRRRASRGAAVTAPRRHAKRRWTYQGIGTIVAGTVAVAAVATGTVVLGGTGGDAGSLATRTAAPVPRDGADGTPTGTSATPPGIPSAAPYRSAQPSPGASPAASTPAPTAPRVTPTPRTVPTTGRGRTDAPTAPDAPAPVDPATPNVANTPRTGAAPAEYIRRVVELVNAERAKAGCGAFRVNSRLQAAAQGHADDMAARDYYEHDTPEGRDAGDRMEAADYRWRTWGENIHRGPKDPATAVRDWMKSPGHRENILNCSFKDIGVGVNLRSNGPWWVQNFGAAG